MSHSSKIKVLIWMLFLGLGACSSNTVSQTTVSFFAFGDWGTGTQDQRNVARAVQEYCDREVCDFGLLLGDNFYENGVTSVADPLWQEYFENIYQGLHLPFYAVLGNHDHGGNVQAQIDYSDLQDRWMMPDRIYRVALPTEADPPQVEIFVLDSETYQDSDGEWLLTALEDSRATWKILALHHPLYSNGSHGDNPTLQAALIPIICQRVDLVLSGHDHIFSHLDDPSDGCTFQQIVAGTGGRTLYDTQPDPRALFSQAAFGFVSITTPGKFLLLQFQLTDGSVAYSFQMER